MSRTNDFWTFALDRYERPGVAPCSLALQDRWGADVMMLLWCCWLGSCGRALGAADLRGALAETCPIREHLLRPLRAARRAMRLAERDIPTLRGSGARLQRAELAAERLAADVLERLGRGLPPVDASSDTTVGGMLAAYLRVAGIECEGALEAARELAVCISADIQ